MQGESSTSSNADAGVGARDPIRMNAKAMSVAVTEHSHHQPRRHRCLPGEDARNDSDDCDRDADDDNVVFYPAHASFDGDSTANLPLATPTNRTNAKAAVGHVDMIDENDNHSAHRNRQQQQQQQQQQVNTYATNAMTHHSFDTIPLVRSKSSNSTGCTGVSSSMSSSQPSFPSPLSHLRSRRYTSAGATRTTRINTAAASYLRQPHRPLSNAADVSAQRNQATTTGFATNATPATPVEGHQQHFQNHQQQQKQQQQQQLNDEPTTWKDHDSTGNTSLDAGMATLRRWIRSRSPAPSSCSSIESLTRQHQVSINSTFNTNNNANKENTTSMNDRTPDLPHAQPQSRSRSQTAADAEIETSGPWSIPSRPLTIKQLVREEQWQVQTQVQLQLQVRPDAPQSDENNFSSFVDAKQSLSPDSSASKRSNSEMEAVHALHMHRCSRTAHAPTHGYDSASSSHNSSNNSNHADRNADNLHDEPNDGNHALSPQGSMDEDLEALLHRLNDCPSDSSEPFRRDHRTRALSEPDAVRIRDHLFQRALRAPRRNSRRRHGHTASTHATNARASASITSASSMPPPPPCQPYSSSFASAAAAYMPTSMAASQNHRSRQRSQSETVGMARGVDSSFVMSNSAAVAAGSRSTRLSASAIEMLRNPNSPRRPSDASQSAASSSNRLQRMGHQQLPGSGSSGRGGGDSNMNGNNSNNITNTTNGNNNNNNSNGAGTGLERNGSAENGANFDSEDEADPHRDARARWILINRRFQMVITVVALLFSLILLAILVCWVILTSAYVVSIDKTCDVPLKPYFWLVTLQLILDVFRVDIMRLVFRWDTGSNSRMPCRVIVYNVAYLTYALLVLRLGINAVFRSPDSKCRDTAPELYQSSAAFVALAMMAWATIILGYLLPFCFVASLLTWNGYSPATEDPPATNPFVVFTGASSGAPPGCIDQLKTVKLGDFEAGYPPECCICMEDFSDRDEIIETKCKHVFHKQCCREWLKQARTCPVCRKDITDSQTGGEESGGRYQAISNHRVSPNIAFNATGRSFEHQELREVVSLLRRIRHPRNLANQRNGTTMRRRLSETSQATTVATRERSLSLSRSQSYPLVPPSQGSDVEEGRPPRDYSSS